MTAITVPPRLAEIETTIETHLRGFAEVGPLLQEIRDQRLYRPLYQSFDAYCHERWGWTRVRTHQLIQAAKIAQTLTQVNTSFHSVTERHLRPLVSLPESERGPTLERAQEIADAEDEPLRARHVRQAVHFSSDSVEWATPEHVLSSVVCTLGKIDLDPCSDGITVSATSHFTGSEGVDGLAQDWHGSVYMNPPYGKTIGDWVEKLCNEFAAGHTIKAIALLPARTDTAWFRLLREFPKCFLFGRLRFSGYENTAPFPSMACYLGLNHLGFRDCFVHLGDTYVRF